MSKRWLAFLFAFAAILRLGFIWVAPAWYDENFTLILSRLPFAHMLAAVAGDVHPPLWYLLLWPLGQLHAPIWVLRLPAAVFSLVSLWLFWRILQALDLTPHKRAAAMILMTIMPIQLYYAQEARMYALLEFLVLAACLAILNGKWAWFILASVLMLYTQYYGVFYLVALCLAGFAWHKYEQWRYIFMAGALAGLAFLPWVFVLRSEMGILQGNYWMQLTGPGMVLRILFENLFMPPANAVAQIPLMLAGFAWLAIALVYALHNRSKSIGFVAWMAILPFALAVLFSLVWQPVLHYRPLIGISPFLYILLASPLCVLFDGLDGNGWNLRRVLFAAIFIMPLILVCDGRIYSSAKTNKLPASAAELAYIKSHWQSGDILYHFSDDSWINSTPYNDLPNFKAPDCGSTLGALSPATRAAIGQQIAPLSDLQYKRAWLLWTDNPLAPACNLAQKPAGAPQLVASDDEYVFDGLWLLEK